MKTFYIATVMLLIVMLIIYGIYSFENKHHVINYWDIQSLTIAHINKKDEFDTTISFQDDNKLILPTHDTFTYTNSSIFSRWIFERNMLLKGKVYIEDEIQGIFTGTYDLKFVQYQEPMIIHLKSPKISLKLKEIKAFSFDKTHIKQN